MPRIRLLVSVAGAPGQRNAVIGDAGAVLTVDNATARVWCDGERAERVIDRDAGVERTVLHTRVRGDRGSVRDAD